MTPQATIFSLVVLLALLVLVLTRLAIKWRRQQQVLEKQSREIQQHLQEIREQNLRHEEILRQRKQLSGIVSHDLKGPLNRIFALTRLMALEEPLSEKQKMYVNRIHQLVADGLGMIRNLIDTRNLEYELEQHPEAVSLPVVVDSIMLQFRVLAERKKIQIVYERPQPVIFHTDRTLLNRILENLLGNAIKFSSENTKVFLKTRVAADAIAIDIRDEGPGFSADDQALMFRKFQKLSAQPTAGETSTGLGLWIIKELSQRLGGSISLETHLGKGSTFTLTIPRQTETTKVQRPEMSVS